MTEVTDDAVTAAEKALRAYLEPWHGASVHGTTLESQIHTAACIALRDAAPLIVSHRETATAAAIAKAERDRIRQLAIEHDAFYAGYGASGPDYGVTEVDLPFADLLAEPAEGSPA